MMSTRLRLKHLTPVRRAVSGLTALALTALLILPPSVMAQGAAAGLVPGLPVPGAMVHAGPAWHPAVIRGLQIYPDNPLQFSFFVDSGDSGLTGEALKEESGRLIRYFLAALTVPEDDLWVNLSPYEADRIIPEVFGRTEMGRDLLAQDYVLKQLTSSLMYPEERPGRDFWGRVYERIAKQYGGIDIPVDAFNKVWIMPEEALVYVDGERVFVARTRLKVMLEEDYMAATAAADNGKGEKAKGKRGEGETLSSISHKLSATGPSPDAIARQAVREIILPEIEREVNEGQTFAPLRQIYHSLILAAWFKKNLQRSFLGRRYAGQNKIAGVESDDPQIRQKIYDQYLAAYRRGVYNYIKQEIDPVTQQPVRRKYFSGGTHLGMTPLTETASSGDVTPVSGEVTRVDVTARWTTWWTGLIRRFKGASESDTGFNPGRRDFLKMMMAAGFVFCSGGSCAFPPLTWALPTADDTYTSPNAWREVTILGVAHIPGGVVAMIMQALRSVLAQSYFTSPSAATIKEVVEFFRPFAEDPRILSNLAHRGADVEIIKRLIRQRNYKFVGVESSPEEYEGRRAQFKKWRITLASTEGHIRKLIRVVGEAGNDEEGARIIREGFKNFADVVLMYGSPVVYLEGMGDEVMNGVTVVPLEDQSVKQLMNKTAYDREKTLLEVGEIIARNPAPVAEEFNAYFVNGIGKLEIALWDLDSSQMEGRLQKELKNVDSLFRKYGGFLGARKDFFRRKTRQMVEQTRDIVVFSREQRDPVIVENIKKYPRMLVVFGFVHRNSLARRLQQGDNSVLEQNIDIVLGKSTAMAGMAGKVFASPQDADANRLLPNVKITVDPDKRVIRLAHPDTGEAVYDKFGQPVGELSYDSTPVDMAAMVKGIRAAAAGSATSPQELDQAVFTAAMDFLKDNMTAYILAPNPHGIHGLGSAQGGGTRLFVTQALSDDPVFLYHEAVEAFLRSEPGRSYREQISEPNIHTWLRGPGFQDRQAADQAGRSVEPGHQDRMFGRQANEALTATLRRLTATASSSRRGGIDYTLDNLPLQETGGEAPAFDLPSPAELEHLPFDGITPVIFQMTPVNLPVLPGLAGAREESSPARRAAGGARPGLKAVRPDGAHTANDRRFSRPRREMLGRI